MGFFDSTGTEDSKTESIKRLTNELVETRQALQRQEEELRAAVGGRSAAVNRIRELEDVVRIKDRLSGDTERMLEASQLRSEELSAQLAMRDRELTAIREEQASFPLSDMDLLHRYHRQKEAFEAISEALTCPICYSEFAKGQLPVSLLCGHSFCAVCFGNWEEKHLSAWLASPSQGAYPGPDCPECRSTDVRRGKVRIWAMEEVVRLVERSIRDAEVLYTPPQPIAVPTPPFLATTPPPAVQEPSEADPATPPALEGEPPVADEAESARREELMNIDMAAASFLAPRRSTPYAATLR